jgi:hypothetical protein
VANSIEFPKTSINEVASALGVSKTHNVPLFEAAVWIDPQSLHNILFSSLNNDSKEYTLL